MVKVILTHNKIELNFSPAVRRGDCDCDCDCACPLDPMVESPLPLPASYYLELTYDCQNACPACGNRSVRQGRAFPVLNAEHWREIIARLATHAHYFEITGGEPTLHPEFEAILNAIEETGIHFTLFTNGRWRFPERMIRKLRQMETCDGLLISLHGPVAAIHERFTRVKGSFRETITNIRRAAEAGLEIAASMVITAMNFEHIEETLDLALELGANHLVCNRLIGREIDGLSPSEEQLLQAVKNIEQLRRAGAAIRFGNCIPQCFVTSSSKGCTAGLTFATIGPLGEMRPCNHTSLVAGNVLQTPIAELWHSEVMGSWRDLIPSECHRCSAYATCHGGCRAQALLVGERKDPLMQGPLKDFSIEDAPLYLSANLRPIAAWEQDQQFGSDVFFAEGHVVWPPAGFLSLLPRLDGTLTLEQIQRRYGQRALDWIGDLAVEGLISLH